MTIDRYELFSLAKVLGILVLIAAFFVGLGMLVNFWFSGSTTAMAIVLIAWRGWQSFKSGKSWWPRPW